MSAGIKREVTPMSLREAQIEKYWAGDLARKVYLFRRQRKAILENCRRIVVVGASRDPNSASFLSVERLLGMGLEIIPVFPGLDSFLGLRCYSHLRDVPGKIDIVQIFPDGIANFAELAKQAVEKNVATFWIERGLAASAEVEEILSNGKVQLVEYESFEVEYLKHTPFSTTASISRREIRKAAKVLERMSKNPVTVKLTDEIKEAVRKMDNGHFRHLPVTDDAGRLIGMLSDRDIRLIRNSLTFGNNEAGKTEDWSAPVY
jgi:predicted CoA-binding protein